MKGRNCSVLSGIALIILTSIVLLNACENPIMKPYLDRLLPGEHTTHTWGEWNVTRAATCVETGEGTRTCDDCGELDPNNIIPINPNAHDRNYQNASVQPTCIYPGMGDVFCNRTDCDWEETDFLIPLGHEAGTAATCETPQICIRYGTADCDLVFQIALEHDWIWFITIPPTQSTAGQEARTCSKCDQHENKSVAALSSPFTSNSEVESYLARISPAVSDPVYLPVNIPLGTMSQEGSGWRNLLGVIKSADTFVDLDLSGSTMTGTEFNADRSFGSNSDRQGKDKIVSIVLPTTATTVSGFCGEMVPHPILGWVLIPSFFSNLGSVTGMGVSSVNADAFSEMSSLTTVEFPVVEHIGNNAFSNCTNLTDAAFAEGSMLITIGSSAFANTGITSIIIPSNVTSIGEGAFSMCRNLGTVIFAEGSQLTTLPFALFNGNVNLTSITIPSSIRTIEMAVFIQCVNLTTVTFAAGSQLARIQQIAFSSTGITSITIPATVRNIEQQVFRYCDSLTTITFAEDSQLTTIGYEAFLSCTNIESITIPPSVTGIGPRAFENWTSAQTIYVPFADQAAADAVWGTGWRDRNNATIVYQGP